MRCSHDCWLPWQAGCIITKLANWLKLLIWGRGYICVSPVGYFRGTHVGHSCMFMCDPLDEVLLQPCKDNWGRKTGEPFLWLFTQRSLSIQWDHVLSTSLRAETPSCQVRLVTFPQRMSWWIPEMFLFFAELGGGVFPPRKDPGKSANRMPPPYWF